MLSDGIYVDGSWELTIQLDDLLIDKRVRVHSDWNIGTVIFKLVESLDIKMNWSDHALWWPAKSRWLMHTRTTLEQFGVQADALLRFLRVNNSIIVQLPDLQTREFRVNYSKTAFSVAVEICRECSIRHPEELALMRRVTPEELKRPRIGLVRRQPSVSDTPVSIYENSSSPYVPKSPLKSPYGTIGGTWGFSRSRSAAPSPNRNSTLYKNSPDSPNYLTLPNQASPSGNQGRFETLNGKSTSGLMSPASVNSLAFEGAEESQFAESPYVPSSEAFEVRGVHRPTNLIYSARLNGAWLDSSLSLMEQGIEPAFVVGEEPLLLLRFKYCNFYDLNPKYDSIRINQLYHQCRWSLLSEEVECTEDEMMVFAGLQLQVQLQASHTQQNNHDDVTDSAEDEIDAILNQLQFSLDGTNNSTSPGGHDLYEVPELSGWLKFFKPKKFSLKHYKKFFMVLRDTQIFVYKSEDTTREPPQDIIELKGCEVQPDVNITTHKYGIRLFVAAQLGCMQEIWLRCSSQEEYADWFSACRLAYRGKTLASKMIFEQEKQTTLTLLRLQAPKAQPVLDLTTMPRINPEDFVASRFVKRIKQRHLMQRLLTSHSNVRTMNTVEAKLQYIKAWQQLPQHGINYFVVRFDGSKKDDLVGIASTRIIRADVNTGDALMTWRYSDLKSWHVNWETKQVVLNFTKDRVAFHPISASCKTVHEFVGGHIFLNLRTPEKNQSLDERTFHKFTGGIN